MGRFNTGDLFERIECDDLEALLVMARLMGYRVVGPENYRSSVMYRMKKQNRDIDIEFQKSNKSVKIECDDVDVYDISMYDWEYRKEAYIQVASWLRLEEIS